MIVTVCGVRGSTPASGREFVRHGGATSCVAVAHRGEPPTLLLDAGTGIRRVDAMLGGAAFRGSVLLGHLHLDHVQGLAFLRAAMRPDAVTTVWMPAQGDPDAVIARLYSPPFFPVAASQLAGAWSFRALEPGTHEIEGFTVEALEIPHPGGRTFGYRVSDAETSLAYLSDHSPTTLGVGEDGTGARHDAAVRLAAQCDLLVHDAQYLDDELASRAGFGHSCPAYAVGLGVACGVRRVVLFHHDPSRTDDELDALLARYASAPVPVDAATEGTVYDLSAPTTGAA